MGEESGQQEAPICEKCKTIPLVRIAREGLLESRVYSKMGLYPWECPVCRDRVLVKSRGKKRRRRHTGSGAVSPVDTKSSS